MSLVSGVQRQVKVAQATLPWRAWQRYGNARGGVLAGGMAYVAFFSLLPALAVGFTVFGLVVHNNADLQARVIKAVNDGVGTVVITPPGGTGGIVSIGTLTGTGGGHLLAAAIGLVGFLLTGLGWLDAMREGIRAMFGQPTLQGNVLKTKGRDLAVLASIGMVLLLSAVLGVVVTAAAGTLLGWVGLSDSTIGSLIVGGLGTLLVLAVDVTVFMLIFWLLSGVHVPRHDLWDAALFGGIGLGVLKLLSGLLLKSAGTNKLLAVAAVVLGLLIWLNLVSRLTLVAAAWGATVALDRGHLVLAELGLPEAAHLPGQQPSPLNPQNVQSQTSRRRPVVGAAVVSPPRLGGPAVAVPFTPVVSPRSADRISLAAGAILGAATLFAVRSAGSAVRTAVTAARHRD